VAVDPTGALFIADPLLPGVFRRESGGALDVFARGGPRDRTPLRAVRALAAGRGGELFAGDPATGEVYRLRAGRPPEPLTGGALEIPSGLAVDPAGDLVVTDLRLGLVVRVPGGGGKPVTAARVPAPRGLAVTRAGDLVVLSAGPDALLRVAPDGRVSPLVTGRPFRFPVAVAVAPEGEGGGFLVSDAYGAAVWSVSTAGEVRVRVRGKPLVRPGGLAVEPSGALLVADPGAGQVFRVAPGAEAVEPLLPAPEDKEPSS
jgi:serine/threonine-protein kinase